MDVSHWILVGLLVFLGVVTIAGFVYVARVMRKDEAIDAAQFLALRELRERFERGELPRR